MISVWRFFANLNSCNRQVATVLSLCCSGTENSQAKLAPAGPTRTPLADPRKRGECSLALMNLQWTHRSRHARRAASNGWIELLAVLAYKAQMPRMKRLKARAVSCMNDHRIGKHIAHMLHHLELTELIQ